MMALARAARRLARRRALRSGLVVALAALAATLTAGASSFGPAPVITSLSSYVVNSGQIIQIDGNNFSSAVRTTDCQLSGPPTVVFVALDGSGNHAVRPGANDSSQCSNTYVRVAVPTMGIGARVYLIDPSNQQSNTGGSGFYPQLTMQPTASLSPSSGPVGTGVTINGNNLHPPTIGNPSNFNLTIAGQGRSGSWGNSITFAPGNVTGDVQVAFSVSGDANNPAAVFPVNVDAGTFTFLPPSVDTTAIGPHLVGDRLNLSGANLGSAGGVTFAGGVAGQGISWSQSGIGVTIPGGAQPGAIGISVAGFGPVSGPSIALSPLAKSITPGTGSAGAIVKIDGYNFGTSTGKVSTGGVDQTVTSWQDQEVAFALSGDSDTGSTILTRSDGVAAGALNLGIVPHLDKLESDNVPAGSQVVVDGVSLGPSGGSVKVAGQATDALLWSRTTVLISLPTGLAPGKYPIVITNAAGGESNPLTITIVPGQAPPTPGTPGSPGSPGSSGAAPSFDNNHTFVKPTKPPSPVDLTLTADPHQAPAGGTADLSVSLKLNGKAVKGAAIQVSMISSPGSDYTFTPQSGTTDENGLFKAKVKISGKPGENVILAQSGVFSDQDHVLGTGGSTSAGTVNPVGSTPWPLFGFGFLAFLFVGGGLFMQLRSIRLLAP